MANLTTIILGIIVIAFFIQMTSAQFEAAFIFDPAKALSEPWRFITSMFLHGDIMHILFNGYALFLFGSILERKVTSKDYLIIFFLGGLVGGFSYFLTILLGIIPPIPALGASGAIYAILGAVAMLLPDLRIFVWFIPMKMKHAAILWIVLEFMGAFNPASGIASAAHLGGLLFGLAYAYFYKKNDYVPPQWNMDYRSSDQWED